ncbi:MAG TPA: HNH endonuclease [Verrucomicrobiota bacterium]|nr:HNH endonuclease [Verrucomicrobiota bacterium]
MRLDDRTLTRIYARTSGYCHLCGSKLSRTNYGKHGARGAWEIEHSLPRIKGGSDHINNLYPACIRCNRSKGSTTTRTARRWHGRTRAPLSPARRVEAKGRSAVVGALTLGLVGRAVLGPWGAVLGGIGGALIGHRANPDR